VRKLYCLQYVDSKGIVTGITAEEKSFFVYSARGNSFIMTEARLQAELEESKAEI
jgi:hypothetical protein